MHLYHVVLPAAIPGLSMAWYLLNWLASITSSFFLQTVKPTVNLCSLWCNKFLDTLLSSVFLLLVFLQGVEGHVRGQLL